MPDENKGKAAGIVRDISFYSSLSNGENLIRIIVWLITAVIGIFLPMLTKKTIDSAIYGAYFVFSLPLFIDAVLEVSYKVSKPIQFFYGLLCIALLIMFIISGFLSFAGVPNDTSSQYYTDVVFPKLTGILTYLFYSVIVCLFVSTALSVFRFAKSLNSENAKKISNEEIAENIKELRDLFKSSVEK